MDEKTIIVQVVCTKKEKWRRSYRKKGKDKKERSKSEYSLFDSGGDRENGESGSPDVTGKKRVRKVAGGPSF